MSRNTRIAAGLLIPSLIAVIILIATYAPIQAMDNIDPLNVLIMLGFIVTSVFSSTFTAYFYKGLTFTKKLDVLLVYLNAYPWVLFIIVHPPRFWILAVPIVFTPLLGYWFGRRYSTL